MKIKKVVLENFRCFEQLKLEPDPQLNVFVGVNASGKTALLRGIKLCLGTYIGQFSDIDTSEKQKFYISPEDVRIIQTPNGSEFASPTSFSCEVEFKKKNYSWSRKKEGRSGTNTSKAKDIGAVQEWVKKMEEDLKHPADGPDLVLPLVAYFSTDRVSGERKFQSKDKLFTSRMRGYFNSLGDFTNMEYLKEWFKNRQLAKFQHGESPSLDLMKEVVKRIPGVSDIEYIIAPSDSLEESDLYLKYTNGDKFGFEYLSDGTKMFLAMLADIAMRCILLNPSKGATANKTPGVVMIDEVDLHLHPSWQRIVIQTLTGAFPNIQFFITTHSPQVLSEVPGKSVFILENFQISPKEIYTEGRDSNSILEDVFGYPELDEDSQMQVQTIYDQIDIGNADTAKKLLADFIKKRGENDREVVRMQSFIDFL